jgi:plastocyanin
MNSRTKQMALGAALMGALGWTSTGHAHGLYLATVPKAAQENSVQEKAPQEKAASVEVKIDNFNFEPREITVEAGTTVVWTNRDDVPHTVTSNNDKFTSKALDTDDQFSFTFKDPGTYEYYCSVHPKMTAKVIVK